MVVAKVYAKVGVGGFVDQCYPEHIGLLYSILVLQAFQIAM